MSINRITLTGNLTRDPELRETPTGTSVCGLRIANNARRRKADGEGWEDRAHFFDVTVWGARGETCARYLKKGRQVAVDGRLEHREWKTAEGEHRQAVSIVADTVEFLGSGSASAAQSNGAEPVPVSVGAAEDSDDADGELEF